MDALIDKLNSLVWSWPLVILCLVGGLYFTVGTRFLQVRKLGEMVRLLFHNDKTKKVGISSFQAFALALSGRVGTGNIVGVAMAVGYGGPGAVVWMWIVAFMGAGTAFAEATLAQMYKCEYDGELRGGPSFYIEHGLRCKWLAMLFALCGLVAGCALLPPIHSNGIASSFALTFGIEPWVAGVVVAVLIALVVMGGVSRIAKVAQAVTPFVAMLYVLLSVVVLVVNYQAVPAAFADMIGSAFGVHQVLGGIMGLAVSWGVKRGIYSNEAGQGTGAIVAAAAKVDHPVKQGLVQGFSVYVDTLLVCTATALMLLATGCYNVMGADGELVMAGAREGLGEPGVGYTIAALATLLGDRCGGIVISVALFFFAFTTIMAYYYYADTCLMYLVRKVGADPRSGAVRGCVWGVRVLLVSAVVFGSVKEVRVIWNLGDVGVGVMAWINIVSILLLSPKVFRVFRDYERGQKQGEVPSYTTDDAAQEFWYRGNK